MKREKPRRHPPGFQPVRRLPLNRVGRDFAVGDVHGAYDLVIDAMRKVRFDRTRDRLLSVGDLVNRGDDSARALAFLSQPYVYAIRGNHEDLWEELYFDGPPRPEVVEAISNVFNLRMDWWQSTPPAKRDTLVAKFAQLPFAMEVQTHRGTVGLVHGDVPADMPWQTFIDRIEAGDEDTIHTALWGRDRSRTDDHSGVEGVGRVFVGHTPHIAGATRRGNVVSIDTGAIFGLLNAQPGHGHLTMANLAFKTESLDAGMEAFHRAQEMIAVHDQAEPSRPFSNYSAPRGA